MIGFPAGIPKIPLNLALLKSCQIVGVFLGGGMQVEPRVMAKCQRELEELIASGKLVLPISRSYRLDEVPQALRGMLDRRVTGKVVYEP